MFTKHFWSRRSLRVRDNQRTNAAELSLRASLWPICLVTILFFLWGFSYGLLDTLNKHFQETLGINKARSTGLQVAYFGSAPPPSPAIPHFLPSDSKPMLTCCLETAHTLWPRSATQHGSCATIATGPSLSGRYSEIPTRRLFGYPF